MVLRLAAGRRFFASFAAVLAVSVAAHAGAGKKPEDTAPPRAANPAPAATAAPAKPTATETAVEPSASGPDSTTERYGDWTVVCSRGSEAAARICESNQSILVQGENQPIARLAVGRIAKDKPQRLVVIVPVNVMIASGLRITTDPAKDPLNLAFRTCAAGGCVAETELSPAIIDAMKGKATPGQIAFDNAGGQKIAFQFSLRGFDKALEALRGKE